MKKESEWNFGDLWELSLDQKPRTEFTARDRIWASELQNAPIDLWHKLKGTNPSNVPDLRSMLKFEAGNMTEFIVRLLLLRIGVFRASQTRVMFDKPGLFPVSGKIDFEVGGGLPVQDQSVEMLLEMVGFPEALIEQADRITRGIVKMYPGGIKNKIIELKSVASYGMNKILVTKQAVNGHELQAFHYAYNTGREVELLYICRDDWRKFSITIRPDDPVLLKRYMEKIELVTRNHMSDVPPPKEPLILYDDLTGKFSRNFNVQYSSYLKMLYGFDHAEQYADWFKAKTRGWNAGMSWYAKGKNVTPKKKEALDQIAQNGFDVELIKKNIIDLALKGIAVPEEEVTEE